MSSLPNVRATISTIEGSLSQSSTQDANISTALSFSPTQLTKLLGEIDSMSTAERGALLSEESRSQARFAVVETAVRELFNRSVASASIFEATFSRVWELLDITTILSDHERCEPGLIFWLIEELLDSQTIEGCQRVFDYLESRRERLISRNFKQKSLIILRSCNELLRRLSRAENTVFCGRVFIFLFQSFPLGDRSSVNLRGEYHTDNITTFDELPAQNAANPENMDVDHVVQSNGGSEPQTAAKDDKAQTQDASDKVEGGSHDLESEAKLSKKDEKAPLDLDQLYPIFWSLQQIFSNPTRLFDPSRLSNFKSGLEATLRNFKEIQRITDGRAGSIVLDESRKGLKRKRGEGHDNLAGGFNPKYLTSRDLFDLEVNDLAFRRHILVQALILLDFLQSLTPKAKSNLNPNNPQNKSVLYSFTLSDEETRWVTEMKTAISTYLQHGQDGKFYYRMVDTVLSRDKNWVRWKVENCPPIEHPPITAQEMIQAKQGIQRSCTSRKLRATALGSLDLSFLSDEISFQGLEGMKKEERFTVPSVGSFESGITNDGFDIDLAKTDEERQSCVDAKASKTWRALRLASKHRLNVLDKIDDNAQNLQPLFKAENGIEESKSELTINTVEVKPDVSLSDAAFLENPKSADPVG